MDVLDEEILALWRAFHENGVQYIMVGGFATNMHGYQRATGDIDIWIKDTLHNRQLLRKSLKDLNVGDFKGIETMDFVPGWSSISLLSGFDLDIMTYLKGFDQEKFDDCFQIAPTAIIHNIPVKFLHINQLIEAKQASARERDLIDIIALEKLKAAQLTLDIDSRAHPYKMHYLILLRPDEGTVERIKQSRNHIEKITGSSFSEKGFVPHITLLDFERVENDRDVIAIANQVVAEQRKFHLKVQEASRFDHTISETIAAIFRDPMAVVKLHYNLSLAYDKRPKTSFVPHITIAKEIPKTTYNVDLSLSSFIKEWEVECDTLVILRKLLIPGGENKSYTNIGEIKLQD